MPNETRTALYVSTIEVNKDTLLQKCFAQIDFTIVAEYQDNDLNGTERPEFNQMIFDAKDGNFELILTPNVNGFSSNIKETLQIVRELKDYGMAVWFIENEIYTANLADELVLQLASNYPRDSEYVSNLLRCNQVK